MRFSGFGVVSPARPDLENASTGSAGPLGLSRPRLELPRRSRHPRELGLGVAAAYDDHLLRPA